MKSDTYANIALLTLQPIAVSGEVQPKASRAHMEMPWKRPNNVLPVLGEAQPKASRADMEGAHMRIVDLSFPIRPHFRWAVAPQLRSSHAKGDIFQSTVLTISCHAYTHVDPPVHFLPGD